MQHSHTWKANSPSTDNEIPCHYWIWKFITVFTRSCQWNLSWAAWIQSTPSVPHILKIPSDIEGKCYHTIWLPVFQRNVLFIFRVENNFKSYILISSSYLCLWLLSNFFHLAFSTKILYAFLISISSTCSTQLTLLEFITPPVFVKRTNIKLLAMYFSPSFCYFLFIRSK